MILTNRYSLPQAYVNAVSRQRTPKPRVLHITDLLKPPQMRALELAHADEITADVADQIDLFFGNAIHEYLARHADQDAMAEQRMEWAWDGYRIVGTPDHTEWLGIDGGTLTDWKTTKVRALEYDRPEWEQQVNLYAHLLRLNGYHVAGVEVWAYLKDWDRSLLGTKETYPRAPICYVPLPLWDAERAHAFLLERIALHAAAQDGAYGPCTDEERWVHKSWALWSRKGKPVRAAKVLESRELAEAWAAAMTDAPRRWQDWWEVEERRSEPLRCLHYCPVAQWCEQWRAEREAQADTEGAATRGEPHASLHGVPAAAVRA